MNKFHFLILLIYSIFYSSIIPCVNGKTSLDTIFNDTTEKSFNNGLSVSSTVKNKKIDYEQIDYFYDLWINTYFKKKNFEITCDNIMNHLASKKDKLNALNNNKEYSLKQDFKYKKTYDICHYFEVKYIYFKSIRSFILINFNIFNIYNFIYRNILNQQQYQDLTRQLCKIYLFIY